MPKNFIYSLPEILEAPGVPDNLPVSAKWLSGEGAGSWFVFVLDEPNKLKVNRYSKEGIFECEKAFTNLSGFDPLKDYSVTYPSFCNKITVLQEGKKITLIA